MKASGAAKCANRLWRFFRALDRKGLRRFFQSLAYLARHFNVDVRTIRRWRSALMSAGLLRQISERGHHGKFPEFELTPLGRQSCRARSKTGAKSTKNWSARRQSCPVEMSPISPSGSVDVYTDTSAVLDCQRQHAASQPEVIELVKNAISNFALGRRILPLRGRVSSPGVRPDEATIARIAAGLGTPEAFSEWLERVARAIETSVMRSWGLAVFLAREVGGHRRPL